MSLFRSSGGRFFIPFELRVILTMNRCLLLPNFLIKTAIISTVMSVLLLGHLIVISSYPRIARKSRKCRSKFQVFSLTFTSCNALNLGNRTNRITNMIHVNERHILFRSPFWDCSDYLPCGAYLRGIKSLNWEFVTISTTRNPSCAPLWVELTS